jgi:hypothetical protein
MAQAGGPDGAKASDLAAIENGWPRSEPRTESAAEDIDVPHPLCRTRDHRTCVENGLFLSRWLMAPFYVGLVVALAMLLIVFVHELIGPSRIWRPTPSKSFLPYSP